MTIVCLCSSESFLERYADVSSSPYGPNLSQKSPIYEPVWEWEWYPFRSNLQSLSGYHNGSPYVDREPRTVIHVKRAKMVDPMG